MSVGESPVNTLSVQSPEVAIAQKTLRQVCREVQAEGWVFNTETEYELVLDSSNHAVIPNNVLQIDLNHFKHADDFNVVRKKSGSVYKLYDLYEHRFNFEDTNDGKLYCDIIWMVDFEEIPQVFKDYITAKASRIASTRMINDTKTVQLLVPEETMTRALAVEYDTRQADYNVFNDQQFRTNSGNVYRPYKVLQIR